MCVYTMRMATTRIAFVVGGFKEAGNETDTFAPTVYSKDEMRY